jgi:hypothetical protein
MSYNDAVKRTSLIAAFILTTVSNLFFISPSFAGTSYSFTNAGATGFNGPTQAQIDSAYSGSTLQGLVTISTRGIQSWTVPTSGEYSITIAGAAGGSNSSRSLLGGGGALLTTVISLTAGTVLSVVVGQKGTDNSCSDTFCGAAGGGGSFVYTSPGNTFLAVAGGGGGAASTTSNLFSSKTTADGKALVTSGTSVGPTASPCTPNLSSTGGTNGSGGSLSNRTPSNTNTGAPGAGVSSAGATYSNAEGKSLSGNWLGGNSTLTSNRAGGFGGGAAATSVSTWFWAGGGGGYSGGAAGFNAGCGDGQYGGGGGSYYTGNLTSSSNGANSSHGYVTITQQTIITANFNSFALAGNSTTATFRTVVTINASIDVSARVSFKQGNSFIPGCRNRIATGSGSIFTTSCTWKPSQRGFVTLSAIATPIAGGNIGNATPVRVAVLNRVGSR